MNIGLKDSFDKSVIDFYDNYYDVLRTPDFKNNTRLLKPEHGLKYLGNPKHKTCRFCGKNETEVGFKKIAHAFPESVGNKSLATYYECDECNQFFGETIEREYANFFWLYVIIGYNIVTFAYTPFYDRSLSTLLNIVDIIIF